jgi:hypothetical protein
MLSPTGLCESRVAEDAVRHFITNDVVRSSALEHTTEGPRVCVLCQVNVEGIVLAGPGGIKDEFRKLVLLDGRIAAAIVALEDTAMTGRLGFFEARAKRACPGHPSAGC